MRSLACFVVVWTAFGIDRSAMDRLLQLSRTQSNTPQFREALVTALGADNIKTGTAVTSNGPDFVWAVDNVKQPTLVVNDQPVASKMRRIGSTSTWFHFGQLAAGASYRFHYKVDGATVGGANDIPAYTPDSYEKPGVPRGTLTPKMVHTSKLYPGMQSDYWVWVPAQYNPAVPAALMVWQDGERYNARNTEEACRLCPSLYRLHEVTENLIHQKKIPVMIHVFISPGTLNGRAMRATLYDTMSDLYSQFLMTELLPEVYAKYNIRKDAYSRAIQGQSSGGICAFNVAWRHPDQFSRVYTVVASYVSIGWRPGEIDGGNVFPFLVRREQRKNLRVYMNDGSEDQESNFGSWPLQNIQMANSLKLRGYDFKFTFGGGTHHAAQASAELPGILTWLWRDYDPQKTQQTFEQDAEEKAKPPFRVRIHNR